MAEPVLPIVITQGQTGALANTQTLDAFHNNWIHSAGQRTWLPSDFVPHNAGAGLDTATTKLSITDVATQSNPADTRVMNILDNRTFSADQAGLSGLRIELNPTFTGPIRNISTYDALSIYAVPGNGFAGLNLSVWSAIGLHFDGITLGTLPLMIGFSAHMGIIAGVVSDMRTVHGHYHLLFGGVITKATGLYVDDSNAQRTWGFRIGGRGADSLDAYPSYHMGPIGLGGVPTSGGVGGQFDPAYMLDLRERRKMVRTVSIVTHGNTTIEPAAVNGSIFPNNIFDFPFEGFGTITASNIPGGTTISAMFNPISATLSAPANSSATVTATITKQLADQSSSAIKMSPQYDGAVTITRHNYLWIDNPILVNGTLITDACVFRFDAAAGAHKAVDAGTTKTTPGAVSAWLKCNVANTIYFLPMYTSKTS